ncbi:hypothetical protein F0562_024008 [Nyssa sinensis]|uniref:Uncharacterized protein n=1 Tax=Nyssa sinensis TaxID=561372 RepID=A0A5J5BJK5_9ASTE|nr:hypothetical protein F0562_024008 [Nyssa sinensis]
MDFNSKLKSAGLCAIDRNTVDIWSRRTAGLIQNRAEFRPFQDLVHFIPFFLLTQTKAFLLKHALVIWNFWIVVGIVRFLVTNGSSWGTKTGQCTAQL